ncbi:MAG TPA: hypothetical protein DCL73_16875 [Treponema sp.]|nr:hypothetical protein [Treponema sp.]
MIIDEVQELFSQVQDSAERILDTMHKGLSMENAHIIADSVHSLNASLAVLASFENEKIFPLLQKSPERSAKLYGEKYAREISRLASRISAYAASYCDADSVFASQHNFPPVTDFLLESLLNNMDRQKDEIFPILRKTEIQSI